MVHTVEQMDQITVNPGRVAGNAGWRMAGMRPRCVAVILVVGGCAPQPSSRPPAPSEAVLDEVSRLMAAAVEEQKVPGASLVVMRGNDIVLARGYGVESVERPDSVAPTTVFELGSLSKQFTAALILKLAEEGRLSIDDPVSRRLPDFTQLPPGLTIRHLLTHTSGMREIFAQQELAARALHSSVRISPPRGARGGARPPPFRSDVGAAPAREFSSVRRGGRPLWERTGFGALDPGARDGQSPHHVVLRADSRAGTVGRWPDSRLRYGNGARFPRRGSPVGARRLRWRLLRPGRVLSRCRDDGRRRAQPLRVPRVHRAQDRTPPARTTGSDGARSRALGRRAATVCRQL
jgi:hypothetical protein